MELIVYGLAIWFTASFVSKFLFYYNQIEHENTERDGPSKQFNVHVDVEQINGLWYGWHTDEDGREHFVGQGNSYNDAITNCHLRLQQQNPDLIVVTTYKVKKNATVQDQRECNVSQ